MNYKYTINKYIFYDIFGKHAVLDKMFPALNLIKNVVSFLRTSVPMLAVNYTCV